MSDSVAILIGIAGFLMGVLSIAIGAPHWHGYTKGLRGDVLEVPEKFGLSFPFWEGYELGVRARKARSP